MFCEQKPSAIVKSPFELTYWTEVHPSERISQLRSIVNIEPNLLRPISRDVAK